MTVAYPALSGFETEPRKILDLVFSSYLLSDHSQSNEFKGEVISLPKRVQLFDGVEDIFIDDVRSDLEKCLSRYFDQVSVIVDFKTIDETSDNTVHISISATVVRDGQTYDLARTVSVSDSKTISVINQLNG